MNTFRRQSERGSVLLFALTLIGVLSLSAAAVLVSQGSQSTLVGGIRERMVAGYIAEAGLAEASDKVLSIGIGPDGTTLLPNEVARLTKLSASDPICRDGVDCTQWHALSAANRPFGTGNYRIAATCYPNACNSASPVMGYQIRSLAFLTGDANGRVLMEAVLSAKP